MRRQRHPIHHQHRPKNRMHLLRNGPDIMNRPQHITRVRARHQRRLFAKQGTQVFGRQDWGFARRRPPFYSVVLEFGEADPGGNVGFVVDGGEDDVGVRGEVEDEGEVGEELGC